MELGVWSNGEGKEKRQLFLCGKVRPKNGKEKGKETLYKSSIPPYIMLQINNLDENRRTDLLERLHLLADAKKQVLADLVAAARQLFDAIEDQTYAEYGVRKIREQHPTRINHDRRKRTTRLTQLLAAFIEEGEADLDPRVVDVVQTLRGTLAGVCTDQNATSNNQFAQAEKKSVQDHLSSFYSEISEKESEETTPTSSSSSLSPTTTNQPSETGVEDDTDPETPEGFDRAYTEAFAATGKPLPTPEQSREAFDMLPPRQSPGVSR